MINFLRKFLETINDKIGLISSYLILLLLFLVSLSVLLRYVLSIGFIWLQDLYIWIHAIFILLGISFTLKKDEHVRIDLCIELLVKKKIVNLIGIIIFGIPLTYLLLVNGFDYFARSYNLNESSKEREVYPSFIF